MFFSSNKNIWEDGFLSISQGQKAKTQAKKVIKNKLNELISNGNILEFWGSDFDIASIARTSFKDGYNFESKSNK